MYVQSMASHVKRIWNSSVPYFGTPNEFLLQRKQADPNLATSIVTSTSKSNIACHVKWRSFISVCDLSSTVCAILITTHYNKEMHWPYVGYAYVGLWITSGHLTNNKCMLL